MQCSKLLHMKYDLATLLFLHMFTYFIIGNYNKLFKYKLNIKYITLGKDYYFN